MPIAVRVGAVWTLCAILAAPQDDKVKRFFPPESHEHAEELLEGTQDATPEILFADEDRRLTRFEFEAGGDTVVVNLLEVTGLEGPETIWRFEPKRAKIAFFGPQGISSVIDQSFARDRTPRKLDIRAWIRDAQGRANSLSLTTQEKAQPPLYRIVVADFAPNPVFQVAYDSTLFSIPEVLDPPSNPDPGTWSLVSVVVDFLISGGCIEVRRWDTNGDGVDDATSGSYDWNWDGHFEELFFDGPKLKTRRQFTPTSSLQEEESDRDDETGGWSYLKRTFSYFPDGRLLKSTILTRSAEGKTVIRCVYPVYDREGRTVDIVTVVQGSY